MLEKLSFKCGFRHSLEVFYTLEIIKASFKEKKIIFMNSSPPDKRQSRTAGGTHCV